MSANIFDIQIQLPAGIHDEWMQQQMHSSITGNEKHNKFLVLIDKAAWVQRKHLLAGHIIFHFKYYNITNNLRQSSGWCLEITQIELTSSRFHIWKMTCLNTWYAPPQDWKSLSVAAVVIWQLAVNSIEDGMIVSIMYANFAFLWWNHHSSHQCSFFLICWSCLLLAWCASSAPVEQQGQ